MPCPNTLLLAFSSAGFSFRDRLAAMSWLEMVLWVGMASLTIALLVLVGTRWGQVRPVSKCVALSVFAHVLFLAYASSTKLHLEAIGVGMDPAVRVSFTDAGDDDDWAENQPDPIAGEPAAESVVVDSTESAPEPAAEPTPATSPPLLPEPETPAPTETIAEQKRDEPTPAVTQPAPESPVELPVESPTLTMSETLASPEPASQEPVPAIAVHTPPDAAPTSSHGSPSEPVSNSELVVVGARASNGRIPRRPVDDQPLPEPYRLRTAENRLQLALPFGATESSEAGVQAALAWLASVQSAEGRWDASDFGAGRETKTLGTDRQGAGETADTGITGLALLAFLGAGQTHVQGEYRETVRRGLEFLLQQQAADGNLAGSARLFEKMYCHGIASLVLGESFALTGDPRLQSAVRQAVGYSIASQHPISGGWRYRPGDSGDMSQFGWQVMALRSAELGGLAIDDRTRGLMLKFLESATSGPSRGLASYRPRERPSRTMTSEALACRFLLETSPSPATLREANEFVLRELPGQGQPNLYYWYYATLALYQSQGPEWRTWNEALQRTLIPLQRREGRLSGSWDTDDVWGGYGGRVYTTAMGALCLEVYYRYLPVYEEANAGRHAESARTDDPFRR